VRRKPVLPQPVMREFRRPGLWLGIWCLGWVLCVVLSLVHPPRIDIDVPDGDKIGHFLAYGLLSAWSAWIFLSTRARWVAVVALIALGIVLELAQGEFTTDRMMDAYDAWADTIGVALGQLAGIGRAKGFLQRLERRRFG
jgi:VanZ family protein